MYGWRARLGLVVPTNNTTAEPDLGDLVPDGVRCFAARAWVKDVEDRSRKVESVLALRDHVQEAALQLVDIKPAAIGFVCTSASFLAGIEADRRMCADLAAATGVPCVTTSTAVVIALKALGVRRIAMVGPYIEESGSRGRDYFESAGFEVVSRRNLEVLHNFDKGLLGERDSYRLARATDTSQADAVLIPGTNWRAIESIAPLEADLGIPVVTANQATAWVLLALAGVTPDADRGGALLRRRLPADEIPTWLLPGSAEAAAAAAS